MATRTRKPGVRVESSILVNHRPREPKLRKTPPRGTAPVGKTKKRVKLGPHPDGYDGKNKRAAELRVAREKISAAVVEEARATGLMPHEWLLAVMRGEQLNHYAYDADTQEIIEVIVLPTFTDRMEAAKAAAPYFATRLTAPKIGAGGPNDPAKQRGVMEIPLVDSTQQWIDVAGPSQAKLKREVIK